MNWQDLSSVLGGLQNTVTTMVSATIISPKTKLTLLTGNIDVSSINVPIDNYYHELIFVPIDAGGLGFGGGEGNITGAAFIQQYSAAILIYDPVNARYYLVR